MLKYSKIICKKKATLTWQIMLILLIALVIGLGNEHASVVR